MRNPLGQRGGQTIKREKAEYTVQSVLHALDILEAFKDTDGGLGVTELAKKLKLHKNNVFRLLATLCTRGYVDQEGTTGNYRLGVKSFELGQAFLAKADILKLARPVMEELCGAFNETVYLGLIREDKVVYIDIAQTRHSVRVANRVGALLPAHCTAVGKAQLFTMSESELLKVFTRKKLAGYTDNTITDRDKLLAHLKAAAKKGYAMDLEELEPDVFCVGVPIMDYTGATVASICISGPGCRMGRKRMETELAPRLKAAGAELSAKLGYTKAA